MAANSKSIEQNESIKNLDQKISPSIERLAKESESLGKNSVMSDSMSIDLHQLNKRTI